MKQCTWLLASSDLVFSLDRSDEMFFFSRLIATVQYLLVLKISGRQQDVTCMTNSRWGLA